MKKIILNSDHNNITFYYNASSTEPKACVLVICDLTDIVQNYFKLAEHLLKQNISVVIYHPSDIATQSDEVDDYFKETVNNVFKICDYLKERNKNKNIVLMGHGFSAYVVKRCLELSKDFGVAIFSGVGFDAIKKLKLLNFVTTTLKYDNKLKSSGAKIKHQIYYGLEKQFDDLNWLTKNNEYFASIKRDVIFKKIEIFNYYYSFLKNVLSKDKNLENINKYAKILVISGKDDPLIKNQSIFESFCRQFTYMDFDVTKKIFSGFKHNLFNDEDSQIPTKFLINFLNKNI